MYHKPLELWNIEHARNLIGIIEAILRYSEANKLKDFPQIKVYAEEAIEQCNKRIKDEINSLIIKRRELISQQPRIFLS